MSLENEKKQIQIHINAIIKYINSQEDVKISQQLLSYTIEQLENNVESKPQQYQPQQENANKISDISLLTWNLNRIQQTQNKHIERICQLIQDTKVNIVCLQEIREVGALLKMKSLLNKNCCKENTECWDFEHDITGKGYQMQEITACFYQKKIFKLQAVYYGKEEFEFTRKPQILYFQQGNNIFIVCNLHLKNGTTGKDAKIKLENEIKMLRPFSDSLKKDKQWGNPSVIFLAGDFNQNLSLEFETYFDKYSTVLALPSNSTMSQKYQLKNNNQNTIYDQIVAVLDQPGKKTVKFTELEINQTNQRLMNGQYISDHCAVGFDIQFVEKQAQLKKQGTESKYSIQSFDALQKQIGKMNFSKEEQLIKKQINK